MGEPKELAEEPKENKPEEGEKLAPVADTKPSKEETKEKPKPKEQKKSGTSKRAKKRLEKRRAKREEEAKIEENKGPEPDAVKEGEGKVPDIEEEDEGDFPRNEFTNLLAGLAVKDEEEEGSEEDD